jgi:hypothetical protein
VLIASGVEWRRLEVPGLDELLGAGVYYGAGPSEAVSCRGCRVAIVGGGNSAGQAVVRFSRYASQVTLLVRGTRLGDSMSQYLLDRVSSLDNVDIRPGTEVVDLEADTRLRAVVIASGGDASPVPSADGVALRLHWRRTPNARTCRTRACGRRGWLSADRSRCEGPAERAKPLATVAPTLAPRNQPTRCVRRRRRAKRVDQTLLGGHRRGLHGRGVGPPAARRSR